MPGAKGGVVDKHTAIHHQLLLAVAVEVEPVDDGIGPHIRQRHRRGGQEALPAAVPLMHRHHQLAADGHAHLHQIQSAIAAHIHQPGTHLLQLLQAVVKQAGTAVHRSLRLDRLLGEEAAGIGDLKHLHPLAPGLLAIEAGHERRLELLQLLGRCCPGGAGTLGGGSTTHQQQPLQLAAHADRCQLGLALHDAREAQVDPVAPGLCCACAIQPSRLAQRHLQRFHVGGTVGIAHQAINDAHHIVSGVDRPVGGNAQPIRLNILLVDVVAPQLLFLHIHQLGQHLIGVVVDQAGDVMPAVDPEFAVAGWAYLLIDNREEAEAQAVGELDDVADRWL